MISKSTYTGRLFLVSALVMLIAGTLLGVAASGAYALPDTVSGYTFSMLRPMHVSAVMFFILLGATGCVYLSLEHLTRHKPSPLLAGAQWCLWVIAIGGIFWSYAGHRFGGREYWEFDPRWSLPLALAWLLFMAGVTGLLRKARTWPVYVWMWMTGSVFFFFSFAENYLWLFPYFRSDIVTDTTIQWKANGSLVGAWNQLLYGTAFFLMDKISGRMTIRSGRTAFAMYFLGLFNLMFNWGHHVYTLPTENYVRYVGYAVSMTEWIIFLKIISDWKKTLGEVQKLRHRESYRFLAAADAWVFINLFQALLMSVPSLNLFTHGTHVTVAHAMGTTIGINTMIILAACFEFAPGAGRAAAARFLFWTAQGSLLVFWLSLNIAGVMRGLWQMGPRSESFREMSTGLQPALIAFALSGVTLMISLSGLAIILLKRFLNTAPVLKQNIHALNKSERHENHLIDRNVSEPA